MKKTIWFAILAIGLVYVLLEAVTAAGLYVLASAKSIQYDPLPTQLTEYQKKLVLDFLKDNQESSFDARLGWTNPASSRIGNYICNKNGVRALREYTRLKPDSIVRFSAFGNSFTFGADVKNKECWAYLLEKSAKVEVINFGVRAYGLDQAYLRYLQEESKFQVDGVFIGFMSENIYRNVNVYRPFYDSNYPDIFIKPRFILKNDSLHLIPNPLTSRQKHSVFLKNPDSVFTGLSQYDYHYQIRYKKWIGDHLPSIRMAKILQHYYYRKFSPGAIEIDGIYNENSEAYLVTRKIFDEFHKKVLQNGSMPVILIFPDFNDLVAMKNGTGPRYSPLIRHFTQMGYLFVDLRKAFEMAPEEPAKYFVASGGHYNFRGNALVSEYLKQWLREKNFLKVNR